MTDNDITIGKIVGSASHVRYICQIYGPGEVAQPPEPADYAFGRFVRVPLRLSPSRADVALLAPAASGRREGASDALAPSTGAYPRDLVGAWAVGLIYDTILVNPDFGTLGPRLSNEAQVALFSPDYLTECAVLVSILLLGTTSARAGPARVSHGVPPLVPDLGAVVAPMTDAEVRAFHLFSDAAQSGETRPYLHMGYLPHAIAQVHPLLPLAMLHTVERLESLFPENAALLSIVRRNFAWRLKVETAG
ncbi:MAG: hypothetical protein IVW57_02195 [Ktedonobacterales bacterium]|nr:hypothetical protein [Ktedonobacterales bacterium]